MQPVLVNASIAGCRPFPALLQDDHALALRHWAGSGLAGCDRMDEFVEAWSSNAPVLRDLCAAPATTDAIVTHGVGIEALRMHSPVVPRQVYCTIGNYCSQVVEAAVDADDGPTGPSAVQRRTAALAALQARRQDGEPYVCLKGSECVAGPNDTLHIPPDMTTLDWEVEIGVVIGKCAWQVDSATALDHVAGYCVVNDLTLRARIFRQDTKLLGTDWIQSKGRPGWLPTGPWLVPAWAVPEPSRLRLWLRLNGTTMQHGEASDMLFTIAEQIAYLSHHTRLQAGDLLCTGSPAGYGSHYGRYLKPGDTIEAGVDGLGSQRVVCIP